jgi:NAD+ synthase/NAD+ synthase (glutamine-hydrolysing)
VRIALAQIDTTTGDVAGNAARIREAWRWAADAGADLLAVPELSVLGYPPRDLLRREGLVRAAEEAVAALVAEFRSGPAAVLGTVVRNPAPTGPGLWNAAVLARGGRIEAVYGKRLLPTYDVFDEVRHFAPGPGPVVAEVAGRRVGLLVCEDLWCAERVGGRRLYEADPPAETVRAGADLFVSLHASPYHTGKDRRRRDLLSEVARRTGRPLVCCQLVGGNDDVLFDGRSRVFDAEGREILRLAAFAEDRGVVDLEGARPLPPQPDPATPADEAREVRRALVMGLSDYARKTGFTRAVVGMSGGVDSAVTACLAAEALGPDRLLGVSLPGPFTAPMSREDARESISLLGAEYLEIPIVPAYEALRGALAAAFRGRPFDTTEENLQARIRGTVLMALSNKFGHLVLATGNKSEMAVGYCTLYGDMNGGLAVISDVWKTVVYEVAWLYLAEGRIPLRSIDRPPTAELRAGQLDTDSLPPYPVLDRILRRRIEEGWSLPRIVAEGEDRATVERVLRMVERNEYKRRQAAPGLKVTPTAFGAGWRMPIARPVDLSAEG